MITKEAFETKYLQVLKDIMAGNEEAVSYGISALKPMLVGITLEQGSHPVFERIVTDLRNHQIDSLSGDFKSNSRTPWIRDAGLLSMISRHVGFLGDHHDQKAFEELEHRTRRFYKMAPALKVANG